MKPLPFSRLALILLALIAATLAGAGIARTDETAMVQGAESPYPVIELFPAEPGVNDERGFAVAVDGEWLAMGAPREDFDDGDDKKENAGAVYLFHWSGTTWDQKAKLIADPPQAKAQLGFALAMRGGVLAAGAPGEGAVYVFAQGEGVWTQQKRLTATAHGVGAFGHSLAIDGARLAVGAVEVQAAADGAVYLYLRDSWDLDQKVQPQAPQSGERFGSAVSLAGGVLAVGAPGHDVGAGLSAADAGAVYVFQRGPKRWREKEKLLPPESPSRAGWQFGSAVATDGTDIFVGAPTADPAVATDPADATDLVVATNAGAVYRFVRGDAGWVRQELPEVPGLRPGDQLGASLALSGDLLVAGAPAPPPGAGAPPPPPGEGTGKVHVFRRTDASWRELPAATNVEIRDLAGFAVAVDGERVAVGGVLGDQGGGADGAAWSFHCPVEACAEEAEAVARDPGTRIRFGASVALTREFLAIGAPREEGDSTGAVYVYRRAGKGWRQEARLTSDDPLDGFGSAIAVDGERLVVGAPQGRLPPDSPLAGTRAGLVFLYSRSGGSWVFEQGFRPLDPAGEQGFGTSVALAGNVVAIGAPRGGSSPGAVFVVEKVGEEWRQTGAITLGCPANRLGASVSLRDGILASGAPDEDHGVGVVYVARRDQGRWVVSQTVPGTKTAATLGGDRGFGSSVAVVKGILAVGAPDSSSVHLFDEVGEVWRRRQLPALAAQDISGLGAGLALSGNRLLVGARDPDGQGRAFLFELDSGDTSEIEPLEPRARDGFGTAVALSEDFLVVTSPGSARRDRVTVFALPDTTAGPR